MRQRIYFKHVNPKMIFSRRGFEAYVNFSKEALKGAKLRNSIKVATCISGKLYDPNTMIQIA